MKKYIPALIAIILITGACTKEKGILERPAYAFYDVKFTISTTPERFFELVLDDKVVTDSVSSNKVISDKVLAGKHHFKLKVAGSSTFFLDTVVTLEKTKKIVFDFLNINPDAAPILFTAGETQAPASGFYKLALINTYPAAHVFSGKNLDFSFYEIDLNTFELKFAGKILIPKSGFSEYLELPYSYANIPDAVYIIGIKDHDTGEVLVNEQDFGQGFTPLKDPTYNTYLLTFYGPTDIISSKKL